MVGRVVLVAVVVAALIAAGACGGKKSPPGSGALTGDESAAAIIERMQAAVDAAGGHRLEVLASNFVLPSWGGSDGGTVDVRPGGRTAVAHLHRTGDADYEMRFVENQTYFFRGTCGPWLRRSGGGAEVLRPFLFAGTNAFERAIGAKRLRGARPLTVVAVVEPFGAVSIEIDLATALPLRLLREAEGEIRRLEIVFSDWGKTVTVVKPQGSTPDNGPGGGLC